MYRKLANCHHVRRSRLGGAARAIAGTGTLASALLVALAAPAAAQVNPTWIHIAAGGNVTCGIREGNTLWCWGNNLQGQLGIGSTTNQDLPQQVTS